MIRPSSRQEGEEGFTLVELLLAIAVSAIVLGAVSQILIVFFKTSDQTTARLVESRDAQMTSAYFTDDVAAVGTRNYADQSNPVLVQSVQNGSANPTYLPCGTGGIPVLRMFYDDVAKGSVIAVAPVITVVRVAYTAVATGSTYELHRLVCKGSSSPVTSPVGTGDIVIAHDLTAVPTVTCLDAVSATIACTGGGSAVPATLTMTLVVKDSLNRQPAGFGSLTVTLTGQRRQT